MAVVTREGLKKAASNLFWLPFRAALTFFEWLTKILVAAALVGLVGVLALGAYFYFVKSNQPMQIDPRYARSLPPEGMTFRELWQDRFAGWTRMDERRYASGRSKSSDTCRFVNLVLFPQDNYLIPLYRVIAVRIFPPESGLYRSAYYGSKGMVAPRDLSLLDAFWWQIENETWWYWVDHQAICKLPPPKRPAQVSP